VTYQFDYGTAVRVIRHLRNDGTFPGYAKGQLLVRRGSVGYVRDVGTFLQDQIVYAVHFVDLDRIVGCREQELQLAQEPWLDSLFDVRDRVVANRSLARDGQIIVEQGQHGEVMDVLDDPSAAVVYHVQFANAPLLQVPEVALDAVPS
jgi:nitrogen fixation protein NifZ